jgi:RNA-binding protein 5/10
MLFRFYLFKVCIDFMEIICCQAGGSSEIGSMPFPPGVGERSSGEIGNSENYEVITADRAIDESNVGNRILRNMGWQEGLVSSPPTYFSFC